MNVLDKDCLLQLVIDNFQEDVAKSVDYNTGEVGIKYTCLEHSLNFYMALSVVEKIYSTK
ncbi:hypothetical protein [Vibrio bathopelagicus]|uniref:hypothetical protein n=1 Tax=Vibrio bathopelagicus TaxID=2777577 RepID=UPI001865233C|nr:hypothetical protein [Vibrio bathopelagicus]